MSGGGGRRQAGGRAGGGSHARRTAQTHSALSDTLSQRLDCLRVAHIPLLSSHFSVCDVLLNLAAAAAVSASFQFLPLPFLSPNPRLVIVTRSDSPSPLPSPQFFSLRHVRRRTNPRLEGAGNADPLASSQCSCRRRQTATLRCRRCCRYRTSAVTRRGARSRSVAHDSSSLISSSSLVPLLCLFFLLLSFPSAAHGPDDSAVVDPGRLSVRHDSRRHSHLVRPQLVDELQKLPPQQVARYAAAVNYQVRTNRDQHQRLERGSSALVSSAG